MPENQYYLNIYTYAELLYHTGKDAAPAQQQEQESKPTRLLSSRRRSVWLGLIHPPSVKTILQSPWTRVIISPCGIS